MLSTYLSEVSRVFSPARDLAIPAPADALSSKLECFSAPPLVPIAPQPSDVCAIPLPALKWTPIAAVCDSSIVPATLEEVLPKPQPRLRARLSHFAQWISDPARLARMAAIVGLCIGLAAAATGIAPLAIAAPCIAVTATVVALLIDWYRAHHEALVATTPTQW